MRYLCIAVCRRGNERVLKRNKLNQMKRRGEWSVVVFFGGGRAALCVFGWGQWRCHDSGLPWVKALELGSSEDRAGSDSPSSELPDASGSMVLQLALFRPRWPSIVWESRVSEKRAHSANRGSTTYVMKPIWTLAMVLASLSHSGLISSLSFFSMSPWWKNSSVTFSLHCLLSSHGRHGLQISAHFSAICRTKCRWEAFPKFRSFSSRCVLKRDRYSFCRLISVARIRDPSCLSILKLSSAGRWEKSSVSLSKPTADLQWWFSRTEVFYKHTQNITLIHTIPHTNTLLHQRSSKSLTRYKAAR